MDEELYEDLPGGDDLIQEELYDSIETYQQDRLPPPPTKQVAPPLPSVSTIPSSGPPLPARNDPPSLPPRNLATNPMSGNRISSTLSLPPSMMPPPPAAPPSPGPPPPVSRSAALSIGPKEVSKLKPVKPVKPAPKKDSGGGGIDMKTIQQAALKKRGQIDLEALEKKANKKEDDSPPPWAGQLKKRKPVDTVSNTSTEDKEEENVAPWVRSKKNSFSEDSPPPAQPSWVRKRMDSQSDGPPPVAKKPFKDKTQQPTINGGIEPVAEPIIAPKPSMKPTSSSPALPPKLKPTIAPKATSPKPLRDNLKEVPLEKAPSTRPVKKVPPPKPPRTDFPPLEDVESTPMSSEGPPDLGPPRFTPEPPSALVSMQTRKPELPALPKRTTPPTLPPPPPPPCDTLTEPAAHYPPPFSPPSIPAPPVPTKAPMPPPAEPAPPPPAKQLPAPPPVKQPPTTALFSAPSMARAPQPKRYRRRSIPVHDVFTPPALPDRASKPGRIVTAYKPAPAPPVMSYPQLRAAITSPGVGATAPGLPMKPPIVAPLEPEQLECDDFYDDVDTVKKAMPSANVQSFNIGGVTTTETNVDDYEGELYDDVAGVTSHMQRQPLPVGYPKVVPPPPPPDLEQEENYDLHPQNATMDENYDLHPGEDQFVQDETYEVPPVETSIPPTLAQQPLQTSSVVDDVPVEESFYEMVASDSQTLRAPPDQMSLPQSSSTLPASPNFNKKLSKSELKEQKKKEKELEKERILQEKEQERIEKERKRLEELRQKNRKRYFIKNFKHFGFNPDSVPCIFATEAIQPNTKGKDHLILQAGEHLLVLLTSHDKLPEGKYLCEKTDGTVGYVDYRNLKDNVEGDCGTSFPPPCVPAPPPPS